MSSEYKGDIAALWGFSSRHDNDMELTLVIGTPKSKLYSTHQVLLSII